MPAGNAGGGQLQRKLRSLDQRRDRGLIADTVQTLIQTTLDSYDSGVNIVRVNFDGADPPAQVIDLSASAPSKV